MTFMFKIKEILKTIRDIAIIFVIIFSISEYTINKLSEHSTPVERNDRDSFIAAREDLKIELNKLDSIKNENIKKVYICSDSDAIAYFKWNVSK